MWDSMVRDSAGLEALVDSTQGMRGAGERGARREARRRRNGGPSTSIHPPVCRGLFARSPKSHFGRLACGCSQTLAISCR